MAKSYTRRRLIECSFRLQFKQLLGPGLHFLLWPLQSVVGRLSLRIQQLDVMCETKTKDNVFIKVSMVLQSRILIASAMLDLSKNWSTGKRDLRLVHSVHR